MQTPNTNRKSTSRLIDEIREADENGFNIEFPGFDCEFDDVDFTRDEWEGDW